MGALNLPLNPVTVATEIAWLHTLPRRNIGGAAICCAFGYCDTTALLNNESSCPDWPFDIDYDRAAQRLRMCIDTYQHTPGSPFDVDAWEAAKMLFEVPASRANYDALQHSARALLAGYTVEFSTGEKVSLEQWRARS